MEDELIQKLREAKSRAALGGGQGKTDKRHQQGKLTARERINLLLDPGSFAEFHMLAGQANNRAAEGIVVGHGKIDGREVCLFAQDFTVAGGSNNVLHSQKLNRTIERALNMRVPCIGLWETAGAPISRPDRSKLEDTEQAGDERPESLFYYNIQASGYIPQISAIMGPSAGGGGYSPALTDFIFMIDKMSYTFVTGPKVVKSVTGEDITAEELGGAKVHAQRSGMCDFRVKSEQECLERIRKLLSFLPSNNTEMPPRVKSTDNPERRDDILTSMVPSNPRQPYDMRKVVATLADSGDFLEVKSEFAPEIVVGFARLNGCPVGFVANQPMVRAGCMTIDSSDKQARFIRFCDAFNIPLVMLVDTTAYLASSQQEHGGILRHGAKVLYAMCEATVPKISVVLRKAYGGGQAAMGVWPGMKNDLIFAWPLAEIATVGAEQSIDLYYAEEMKSAANPEQFRAEKVKEYRERYANPIVLASKSPFIHDVIEPRDTRWHLIRSLDLLKGKTLPSYPKKHGNIPL